MAEERSAPGHTPRRPLWVLVPVLAAGTATVAFLIALASYIYAYEIILYSLCIGISGGIFTALLTDRLGISSAFAIALIGAGAGLAIYGLYWGFLYQLTYRGVEDVPPFLDFAALLAENTALGRRGRVLFDIGSWSAIAIWATELLMVIGSASAIARKLHPAFARL